MIGAFGGSVPPWTWIGWLIAAFSGLVFIVSIGRMFGSVAQVEVGPGGFHWAQWSDATIPWAAIRSTAVRSVGRQQFLCFNLLDPMTFPSKRSQSLLSRLNRRAGCGDIALSLTGTDGKFDDLVAAVKRYVVVAA